MTGRQALALGGMLFLASLLSPSVARANPTPAIVAAQKKVQVAIARWDLSKKKLAQTRASALALEHRIAALKRLRERGTAGVDAELTALLRDSVAQDASLREDSKQVHLRDADVRRSIVEAFVVIDARISEVKPRMKMGELESRQAAADHLEELYAIRRELRSVVDRLRAPAATPQPQQWSKYEVKINPLDGPKELKEKADFVEDTRDRFSKKRELLAKLIRDAREEQSISRATKDFQTDTKLFDEENRRDRVIKQGGGNRELDAVSNTPQATPVVGAPPNSRDTPQEAAEPSPTAGLTTDGPPPSQTGPQDKASEDSNSFAGGGDPGSPTRPGGGDPGTPASPHLTKQLDLNALLNLRVEALDGGTADLATLEALAQDLAKLDHFLVLQAEELRKRAEQLKKDEAKALSEQK